MRDWRTQRAERLPNWGWRFSIGCRNNQPKPPQVVHCYISALFVFTARELQKCSRCCRREEVWRDLRNWGGKKNLLNFHSAKRCNTSFACQLDGHQEIMRTNEPQGREDLIFLLLSLPSPNKQQKTGSGEAADGLALVVHASRLRELRGKWIKYEGKRVYLLHLLVPLLSTTTQTFQSILHAVRRLRVKLVLGGQKVEI